MEGTGGRLVIQGCMLVYKRGETGPQWGGQTGAQFCEVRGLYDKIGAPRDCYVVGHQGDVRQVAHCGGSLVGRHADALLPGWNRVNGANATTGGELRCALRWVGRREPGGFR